MGSQEAKTKKRAETDRTGPNRKKRTNPNPENRSKSGGDSSDDENLAKLRERIRQRKMTKKLNRGKMKLDQVVEKLRQSHSEDSEMETEKARKTESIESERLTSKQSGSSSEDILKVDFSANA